MKKKIKISLFVIIGLVSAGVFISIISPRPTTYAIQKLFEGGLAVKPDNYDEILKTVSIEEDVTYPSKFGNNTFDLIQPREQNGKMPVIFWMHGGAYVAGDKSDVTEYAVQIASKGYVIVNINYELAPNATYPAPILQLGEVYEYFTQNYQDSMFDFDRIYFAGDSAGAQIVAQFVNIQVNPTYQKLVKIQPIVQSDKISGVLLFCGPYDFFDFEKTDASKYLQFFIHRVGWSYFGNEDWKQGDGLKHSSIINYIDASFPRAFITDANTFSFEEQAKKLALLLDDLGVENESVFYDKEEVKLEHEYQFKMDNDYSQNTFNKMIDFLAD